MKRSWSRRCEVETMEGDEKCSVERMRSAKTLRHHDREAPSGDIATYLSDSLLHLRVRARSLPQHRQDLVEALLLRLPAHIGGVLRGDSNIRALQVCGILRCAGMVLNLTKVSSCGQCKREGECCSETLNWCGVAQNATRWRAPPTPENYPCGTLPLFPFIHCCRLVVYASGILRNDDVWAE